MVPIYTIGAFFADFFNVKTCYLILNVSKTSKRAYRTRLLSTQLESTTRVSTNVELWFRPSNLMTKVTLSHRIYLSKRKRTKVEGPNPVLQINKLLTQLESSLLTSVHGIRRIRVFAHCSRKQFSSGGCWFPPRAMWSHPYRRRRILYRTYLN